MNDLDLQLASREFLFSDERLARQLMKEFMQKPNQDVSIICHQDISDLLHEWGDQKQSEQKKVIIILYENQLELVHSILKKVPHAHLLAYCQNSSNLVEKITVALRYRQFIDIQFQKPMLDVIKRNTTISEKQFEPSEKSFKQFNETEAEVIRGLIQGKAIKTIAEDVFLSPYTVVGHIESIKRKLKVFSKPELINHLFKHGYVQRGD